MYKDIENLKEQMHAQGKIAGHLWYLIKKYMQKQSEIYFARDDIEFLNNHLVYLDKALSECTNAYDRESYERQIKNSLDELKKAKDRLIKKTAELEELDSLEELQYSYEIENARLYKLMEEYKELIINENYE